MKKLLTLLTAILISATISNVNATHIMGMNIHYEHLSGDTFEVVLDFYRYCGGTAFNNGNCVSSAGVGSSFAYYLRCEGTGWQSPTQIAPIDNTTDVSPICESQNNTQNSCVVGSCGLLGIQRATYRDTIVLSASFFQNNTCNELVLVFASGARNTGVNYVSNPSVVAYARMDRSNSTTNSSVQIVPAAPIPVFCDGQEVNYGWSAYDPDGDSLHWYLDTAWNSYSNGNWLPINYASGYSPASPMGGTISINQHTGELSFIADVPTGYNYANYAIAVTVEEYDATTGLYKGEVHRDVQFFVTDSCANAQPVAEAYITNLTGGTLLDSVTLDICQNSNFSFDLIIADYDTAGTLSADSLETTTNIGQLIPGATYTTTGTNPDTIHISCPSYPATWNTLLFNVTSKDNFCPVNASRSFSFQIKSSCNTYDTVALCSGTWESFDFGNDSALILSVISGDPLTSQNYNCLNAFCNQFELSPSQTTTYQAIAWNANGTSYTDTFTVQLVNVLSSTFSTSGPTCLNTPILISVDVQNASAFDVQWFSNTGVIANDTLDSTTITFSLSGVNVVMYVVSTDTNCSDSGYHTFYIHAPFSVSATAPDTACAGQSFNVSAAGSTAGVVSYEWSPASLFTDPDSSHSSVVLNSSQSLVVTATDTGNCTMLDTAYVVVEPNVLVGTAKDTTGLPVSLSPVYFVGYDSGLDSVYLIDSTVTNALGQFTYAATDSAFLIKVSPPFTLHPNLLPTYFDNKATVQLADYLAMSFCDTVTYTHLVKSGINPGGPGFIAGLVSNGAGRPGRSGAAGVNLLLVDSNDQVLMHRKTDGMGWFEFDGLIAGEYKVYVDQWGLDNDQAPLVQLTAANMDKDSLNFTLYTDRLVLEPVSGVKEGDAHQVAMYPNPAMNMLHIRADESIENLRLVDVSGRQVLYRDIRANSVDLNVEAVPAGLYLVVLELSDQNKVYREVVIK